MNRRWIAHFAALFVIGSGARAFAADDRLFGPPSVNRTEIRDVLIEAQTRRIDVVGLGDSNQLFRGFGWQDGLTVALAERYPMYATPILGVGDNVSIGVALGTIAKVEFTSTGAPPELLEYDDPGSGVNIVNYGYLAPGSTIPADTDIGLWLRPNSSVWPQNNFNIDHTMRAHFRYGISDAPPGARFRPRFFQSSGFDVLGAPIDPTGASFGVAGSFLEVPAGVRSNNDIRFRWFGTDTIGGVGPVHGLSMRIEDADESTGFSLHTLYGVGGATARDCAIALQQAPDGQLTEFFSQVRSLQAGTPSVIIRISFGANDFSSSAPSVGPDGPFPTNSRDGVHDNIRAITERIETIWVNAGWDLGEIRYLLVGAHQRFSIAKTFALRDELAELAEIEGYSFINHAHFLSVADMLSMGLFVFPSGAHLTEEGYEITCRNELDAILATIDADLNGDCVVDSADLGLLIAEFGVDTGQPVSDLNNDGVVDTADLGALISQFGEACEG